MYEKKDKQRIYWLIDQYLAGAINESTFCDEFYFSFDLELDIEALSELEKQVFEDLQKVASRFSQHEADHALDSHAFSSIQDLQQKIESSKKMLS